MKQRQQQQESRWLVPLLTGAELERRRGDWRRRRRARRRAGALALLAVGAVALIMILLIVGGSGSRAHARRLVAAAPAPIGTLAGAARPGRGGVSTAHRVVSGQDRAVDRALGYTSYVRLASHRRREVALTFDDGPGPYTLAVLRILRRMHAPATFFVVGRWASVYPGVVRVEARDGFEIGDHTESHGFMAALAPAAQDAQITDAASAIHRAGVPYPRLWRPPYGSFDSATLQILRRLRMLMVLWSADTSDYARPGVKRIVYVAVSGAQPGAIILMHDGGGNRAETVAALPRIIVRLRQRGFRLVTVSQLLADDPPPTAQPPPQPLSGRG